MGRLLHFKWFDGHVPEEDPRWFFVDAQYYRDRWRFNPERSFPHPLHIHREVFDDGSCTNNLRIDIRRFIERRLEGDVLLHYDARDYNWVLDPTEPIWRQIGHQVKHGYYIFRFELMPDQVQFALAFSELITREPTDHHSSYPPRAS